MAGQDVARLERKQAAHEIDETLALDKHREEESQRTRAGCRSHGGGVQYRSRAKDQEQAGQDKASESCAVFGGEQAIEATGHHADVIIQDLVAAAQAHEGEVQPKDVGLPHLGRPRPERLSARRLEENANQATESLQKHAIEAVSMAGRCIGRCQINHGRIVLWSNQVRPVSHFK